MEVNIPFLHNVDWGGMAPRMLAILTVRFRLALQPLLCLCLTQAAAAYSVLTRKAHAYAYGGAIIQDMGYYPFGSKMFSDLAHYVRSGDFVLNLLAGSQNLE